MRGREKTLGQAPAARVVADGARVAGRVSQSRFFHGPFTGSAFTSAQMKRAAVW